MIKTGDTVLDIGANIGYYTLILADLVGKNGKVYAFEPDPENFSLLKKNVLANGYKNVHLVNKAVGKKNGKIKLYLSDYNMGNHKIFNDGDKRPSVEVELVSLDSMFPNKKVDFIKMDVEGSEPGVLAGSKKVLNHNPKLKFITEFYPLFIEQFGANYEDYFREIEKRGFNIFLIEDNKNLRKISLEQISKITNPTIGNHVDLVCLPRKSN